MSRAAPSSQYALASSIKSHGRCEFESRSIFQSRSDELAGQYSSMAEDSSLEQKKREACMLFSVAEKHLNEDESKDALRSASDALKIFRELGDQIAVADTLRIVIGAHCVEAMFSQTGADLAMQVATDELNQFGSIGDKRGEACMKLSQAEINSEGLGMSSTGAKEKANLTGLEQATSALGMFQEVGDKKMEARTQLVLVNINFRLYHADDARLAASEALKVFEAIKDKQNQARAFHGLAISYFASMNVATGDIDNAVRNAQKALNLFREANAFKLVAFELQVMAFMHLEQDKPQKALPLAEEAYTIFRDLNFGRGWEALSLNWFVSALIRKGQLKRALKSSQEALARVQAREDKREAAHMFDIVISAHLALDASEDALQTSADARTLIEDIADKDLELNLLHSLFQIHVKTDRYEEAVSVMQEAATIAQDLDNFEEEAIAHHFISGVHLRHQDHEKGQKSANEALSLFQRAENKRGEAAAFSNAAIAHILNHDAEKAILRAKDAQTVYQEAGDVAGEASALFILSEAYRMNQKYDSALKASFKRQDLHKSLKDSKGEADTLYWISIIHLERENPSDAEEAACDAQKLCNRADDKLGEVRAWLLLVQVYLEQLAKKGGDDVSKDPLCGKALHAVNEAVSISGKQGDREVRAVALLWRARVLTWSDQAEAALRSAKDAQQIFQTTGTGEKAEQSEMHVMALLADLHCAFGQRGEARQCADRALASARKFDESALEQLLLSIIDQIEGTAAEMQAQQMQQQQLMLQQFQPQMQSTAASGAGGAKPQGLDPNIVRVKLLDMVKNVISGDDEVETDSPFMEAGIDSLSSVELVSQVAKEFQMALSPALIFDFPTVRSMVDHIVEESIAALEDD